MPPDDYPNRRPQDQHYPTTLCTLVHRDGRWRTQAVYGSEWTAKGTHLFVLIQGEIIVGRQTALRQVSRVSGHIDLARGQNVAFAGEVRFGNHKRRGQILWWNDKTGHYHDAARPMPPERVNLFPGELFRREGDFNASTTS